MIHIVANFGDANDYVLATFGQMVHNMHLLLRGLGFDSGCRQV